MTGTRSRAIAQLAQRPVAISVADPQVTAWVVPGGSFVSGLMCWRELDVMVPDDGGLAGPAI
jgi:hypothetical protein